MNILQLLEQDGFSFVRVSSTHGGEYKGACIFCGGTDRLTVHPERQNKNGQYMGGRFICRQCGKYGDAVSHLMGKEGLSYPDACHSIGIEPKTEYKAPESRRIEKKTRFEPRETKAPRDAWKEKAIVFLSWAQEQLWAEDGIKHRQWLHNRGLTDETIKRAGLGWNPKDFYRTRESWGLDTVMKDNGKPKRLWLPHGLVIPCQHDGQVIRLRIRRPEPGDGSRYILAPGSDTRPLILASSGKIWVIVESELDGLLVSQEAGDIAGVIALGNAQAKPDRETDKLLRDADLILSCLDSDEAGKKASWQFWAETYPQFKRWPCIGGKDPGEMFQSGEVSVRDWIQAGIPDTTEHAKAEQPDKREGPGPFPESWINQYDEQTLERLAIMTVDGGLSDSEALAQIQIA